MQTLLTIVHIFVSIVLILVVLLQAGRGGGMGAAFGGASQQIFGGRGAGNFLARVTTVCAVIFFLSSLTLSMMTSRDKSALEGKLGTKTADTSKKDEAKSGADQGAGDAGPAEAPPATDTGVAPTPVPVPAPAPTTGDTK
jgi:preprotein translocase subunit SecG